MDNVHCSRAQTEHRELQISEQSNHQPGAEAYHSLCFGKKILELLFISTLLTEFPIVGWKGTLCRMKGVK